MRDTRTEFGKSFRYISSQTSYTLFLASFEGTNSALAAASISKDGPYEFKGALLHAEVLNLSAGLMQEIAFCSNKCRTFLLLVISICKLRLLFE